MNCAGCTLPLDSDGISHADCTKPKETIKYTYSWYLLNRKPITHNIMPPMARPPIPIIKSQTYEEFEA